MPRPAKKVSAPKDSTANLGFESTALGSNAFLQSGALQQSLSRQRDIRRALIEASLVDTARRDSAFPQSEATPQVLSAAKNNMVALPGQLFYSTQIPVCLWFLTKSKGARTLLSASGDKEFIRARKGETLFIDARKLGTLIDRDLGYIRTLN